MNMDKNLDESANEMKIKDSDMLLSTNGLSSHPHPVLLNVIKHAKALTETYEKISEFESARLPVPAILSIRSNALMTMSIAHATFQSTLDLELNQFSTPSIPEYCRPGYRSPSPRKPPPGWSSSKKRSRSNASKRCIFIDDEADEDEDYPDLDTPPDSPPRFCDEDDDDDVIVTRGPIIPDSPPPAKRIRLVRKSLSISCCSKKK